MKKTFLSFVFSLLILFFGSGTALAQVTELTSGAIYTLKSKSSNRLLNVKNSSLANTANVETWTDTKSDAQRWIANSVGDGIFTFQNVGTGKYLHLEVPTPANNVNVNQYDYINNNAFKWKVVSEGNGVFKLLAAANNNFALHLLTGAAIDGGNVGIYTANTTDAQKWIVELQTPKDAAPTAAIRDEVFKSFQTKYYKKAPVGYVIGASGFWGVAEMMEVVLDAFETTGQAKYRDMFDQVYNNFYATQGDRNGNWMGNEFNDDLAWISIACTRAYLMFGTQKYLTIAKKHFDGMYARAYMSKYGLLAWKGTAANSTSSNSCINGPAEVCACYLAKATGIDAYYTKAKNLYAKQRIYLYVPETGQVFDNVNFGEGTENRWASSYNQGTYLGAALMLYERYGDVMYLEDAKRIAKYSMEHLSNGEGVVSGEDGGNDLPGFKGIMMRYMRRFIVEQRQFDFIPWLHKNAKVAYNNRNSEGIINTAWADKTKEATDYNEFGASTAVSLMVNVPLDANLIVKNPYKKFEAEDFDYISRFVTEACTTDGGGENLTSGVNGSYVGYMNVDFKNNVSSSVEFRVSNSVGVDTIEIRTGSNKGTILGKAIVPATGNLNAYSTVTCSIQPVFGLNTIYLVFKGTGDITELNSFQFVQNHAMTSDITDNGGVLTASGIASNIFLQNLIDNKPATRYYLTTGPNMPELSFQYQSPDSVLLKSYAIQSANDSPERDPKKWVLEGSTDGQNWTTLDAQENVVFTSRYEKKMFNVSTNASYLYFRLRVSERNSASENDFQLAEWQLFGTSVSTSDLTDNGGLVAAQYLGTVGTEESMLNLLDNKLATSYLVKGKTQAWMQYKSTKRVNLANYSLTSAGDRTKDPKNWSLYGSLDGRTWSLVDSQVDQVFDYPHSTRFYSCANPYSYTYFKLDVTANNGGSDLQMTEWQLRGTPALTVSTAFGTQAVTIGDTALFTVNDPREVGSVYQWYKDGELIFGADKCQYTVSSVGKATIGLYSCLVTNSKGSLMSEEVSLKSKNPTFLTDITDNGGILTSTHAATGSNEALTKVTDNSATSKYCAAIAAAADVVITYQSPTPVVVKSYTITSANDAQERDPKTWKLQASNNGTDWVDLDTQINQVFQDRYLRKIINISNTTAYTYYRLNMTELYSNTTTVFQLGEWQLFSEFISDVEDVAKPKLRVYPNPTTDVVFVDASMESPVFVYNLVGQLVYKGQVSVGQNSIDVSDFAKGMYLLKIGTEKLLLEKN